MYDLNPSSENRPITIISEVEQVNPAAEFRATLARLTPRVFVTHVIVVINVLVFLAMITSGVHPLEPATTSLIEWGANFGPKTITAGEWWRLLTCTFVHIGIIHIGFNMMVLMQIGPFVERLLGNLGFFIVYILCGLAGSLTSLAWNPYLISAGASGAIFGLYGALLGFISIRRDSVPEEVLSRLLKGALVFIGYNAVYGVMRTGTDMAAHIGGLCAGLVCGLATSSPLSENFVKRRNYRAVVLALGGIALIAAAAVRLPRPVDILSQLRDLAAVEKKALASYNAIVKRAAAEKLKDSEVADQLDRDVLPEWTVEMDSLAKVSGQNLPDRQKQILLRLLQYMELRKDGWSMLVRGLRTHNSQTVQQGVEKQREAETMARTMASPLGNR